MDSGRGQRLTGCFTQVGEDESDGSFFKLADVYDPIRIAMSLDGRLWARAHTEPTPAGRHATGAHRHAHAYIHAPFSAVTLVPRSSWKANCRWSTGSA